jgi:hypothetical protein
MDEENKPFTVRDRRKFTPDGALRPEAESPTAVEPPAQSPPEHRPEPAPAVQSEAPAEEAVDFPSFLVSLASQASLYLTATEGPREESLRGARHMISILEMLADKTQGRRTAQEDELLERMLYELRMAYVERSRSVST